MMNCSVGSDASFREAYIKLPRRRMFSEQEIMFLLHGIEALLRSYDRPAQLVTCCNCAE